MKNFESIPEAVAELNEWFWSHQADLPAELVELLRPLLGYVSSPVDTMVHCVEIMYAWRQSIDPAGREIAAGIASFCSLRGFHSMPERGDSIAAAIVRAPKKADIEPLENWKPKPKVEEVEPAATPTPAQTG